MFFQLHHLFHLVFCVETLVVSSFVLSNHHPISFRRCELTNSKIVLSSSTSSSSSTEKDILSSTNISKKSSTNANKQGIKNKKSVKKDDQAPLFWKLDDDQLIVNYAKAPNCASSADDDSDSNDEYIDDLNSSSPMINSLQFTIRGRARPLQRHRSSRGFTYNPSAKAQSSFSSVVTSMIDSLLNYKKSNIITNNVKNKKNIEEKDLNDNTIIPFFQSDAFLNMKLRFRLPRPKYHFKSKSFILKPNSPKKYATKMMGKGDIDNLAKFVLDSLNGIVYVDDKQIVSLSCSKIYDFEGTCSGAIDVFIERAYDDDDDDNDDRWYEDKN